MNKEFFGTFIAEARKEKGMTQKDIADKLGITDKAVSKWERGESMPDVMTLVQLSELFEITVDELLADPNALPAESGGRIEQVMEAAVQKTLKRKANKNVIRALSTTLVWFVALLVFVVMSSIEFLDLYSWLIFLYAVPANAIVMLSLRSAWHDFRWNKFYISTIVWGFIVAIHVSVLVIFHYNFWKLYLLGIPGQIAIFLWFRLFRPAKEKEEEANNG